MPTATTVLLMPEAIGKLDQVVDYYRRQIRTGGLSPGDPLPSNRKLAGEWKLSTATILRAMARLQEERWIEPRPGKTPVVRADHPA